MELATFPAALLSRREIHRAAKIAAGKRFIPAASYLQAQATIINVLQSLTLTCNLKEYLQLNWDMQSAARA